jgi:hypothetical protein
MRRREYQHNEDQLSFAWETPRPTYMREVEPLAHPAVWPSPVAPAAVQGEDLLLTPEQRENREILEASLNKRKRPQPSVCRPPERKSG